MITLDNIDFDKNGFANITDYSAERPEGCFLFYAMVDFLDYRYCLLDHIFAATRGEAFAKAMWNLRGITNHIKGIRLYQSED